MNPAAIPNLLSAFRILLIAPAVILLLGHHYVWASVVIATAVFTDGLDGFLARHFGWRTRIGGLLDPVADKLLFVCVFLTLGYSGHIELWLMVLVISRDVVIAGGALLYQRFIGEVVAQPTMLSKANTLMLFFFVAAVLLQLSGMPWVTAGIVSVLRALVVFMVVASGVQYVWVWGGRAIREKKAHAG